MFEAFRASVKKEKPRTLQLTVPEPDPVENPKVETDPAQLQSWLESLPYADPYRAIEMLLAELHLINRFPGKIKKRLKLTDLFLQPFSGLYEDMQQQIHLPDLQALNEKNSRFGSLFRQFTVELAYAYKILINEAAQQKNLKPVLLAHVCYQANKFINLQLLFNFSGFAPAPGILWREMMQIHHFAVRKNLNALPISDEQHKSNTPATLDNLLKLSLLEQLLDPYRLMPGEIWNAHQYLNRWSHLAKLQKIENNTESKPGLFLIDLRGIENPSFLARTQGRQTKDYHRIFNITPVIKLAHDHLHQLHTDSDSFPPGSDDMDYDSISSMLRDMLIAWHMRPQRSQPRTEEFGILQAASGIHDVHFHQARAADNLWMTDSVTAADEEKELPDTFLLRQTNTSRDGLGLEGNAPYPDNLQVGQVLLLQYEKKDELSEEQKSWFLGIVRRLVHRDSSVEFGVQKMSGQLQPVRIKDISGLAGESNFQPGLLIKKSDVSRNLLITPRDLYVDAHEYLVEIGEDKLNIRAEKLQERNMFFDRFRYSIIS